MSDVVHRRPASGPAVLRWGLCLLAVLALHAGMLAVLRRTTAEPPPMVPPVDAVMVELAPPQAPAPPKPAEPEPPPPIPKPEPPPQVQPPPEPPPPVEPPPPPPPVAAAPEIVVPKPKPKPPRPVRPVAPALPRPEPLPAPAPPPTPAAPPVAATPAPQVTANWQSQLLAHIARFKRYPPAAQRRGDQGVAYMRFVITRDGNILSVALDRSSGHAELDHEAAAWLQRAQPLPPPPPEIARDRMELVLPMRFELQ